MAGGFKEKPKDIRKMTGSLVDRLNEKYKKPVIFTPETSPHRGKGRIPFSSFVLNRLSAGGIEIPRMHQFYGPEGVFKSTTIYDLIGNAQRNRARICVDEMEGAQHIFLLDSEAGQNARYMEKMGIDLSDPMFHLIDNYENADEAGDIMTDILKSGEAMFLGLDSLTTLNTSRENESVVQDLNKLQGWNGKFASGLFKKLSAANTGATAVVFVNQVRDFLGDRVARAGQDKHGYSPTGGWAPRYYPSLTIELSHHSLEDSEDKVKIAGPEGWIDRRVLEAWTISARVEKTRMAGNDQQELFFRYMPSVSRVDHEAELLNLGVMDHYIRPKDGKAGSSWLEYKVPGQKTWTTLGNGRKNARAALVKDRSVYDKLAEAITAKSVRIGLGED